MQKLLVDTNVKKKGSAKYMLEFCSGWMNIRWNKGGVMIISLILLSWHNSELKITSYLIYNIYYIN